MYSTSLACRKLVFSSSKRASLSSIDFEISGGFCSTYRRCLRLAGGEGVSVKPEKDGGRLGDGDDSGDRRGFVDGDFVAGGCGDVSVDQGPGPHISGDDFSDDGKKKFVSRSGLCGRSGSGLSVFFSPEIELESNESNLDAIWETNFSTKSKEISFVLLSDQAEFGKLV